MRGLNHPSIVKLLAFSESEEHFFLVLECASFIPDDLPSADYLTAPLIVMEGGELFHQM